MNPSNFKATLIGAAAMLACVGSSNAATTSAEDLAQLTLQARKQGAVAVTVHLESVSLDRMHNDLPGLMAAMQLKSQSLSNELGAQAWSAGRWENGVGQVGLHVTETGLKLLATSSNAVSFRPGQHWRERSTLHGQDGSHAEIERLLDAQGYVDVEVTVNVDSLEIDVNAAGQPTFPAPIGAARKTHAQLLSLLATASDAEIPNRQLAATALKPPGSASTNLAPTAILRITRSGMLRLAGSDVVRSVKPVGFIDTRPTSFDVDESGEMSRRGSVEVLITLRSPHFGGALSGGSISALKRSHKRALDEVLATVSASASGPDLSRFAAATARLSTAQVARLRASSDRRILSVVENKPMFSAQLAVSTPTLNMIPAWNAGYRSAGQTLIVFDSGVQTTHPFLTGRLAGEACFGSTTISSGVQYVSVCPQPDANGDSPLGWPGSGQPASSNFAFPNGICSSVSPES